MLKGLSKEEEFMFGRMEVNMKDAMIIIYHMDKEYILGFLFKL